MAAGDCLGSMPMAVCFGFKKVVISRPSPQTVNSAKGLNQGATGISGFFSSHVSDWNNSSGVIWRSCTRSSMGWNRACGRPRRWTLGMRRLANAAAVVALDELMF